jgi:hypothetical protein
MKTDMINLPQHYARWKIEPIRFIVENGLDWLRGNIIKYLMRYDAKNGLEDLQKARRYLDLLIEKMGNNPTWWLGPTESGSTDLPIEEMWTLEANEHHGC